MGRKKAMIEYFGFFRGFFLVKPFEDEKIVDGSVIVI
jgi:hypothetical protein